MTNDVRSIGVTKPTIPSVGDVSRVSNIHSTSGILKSSPTSSKPRNFKTSPSIDFLSSNQNQRAKLEAAAAANKKVGQLFVKMKGVMTDHTMSRGHKLSRLESQRDEIFNVIQGSTFSGKTLIAQDLSLKLDESTKYSFSVDVQVKAENFQPGEQITAHITGVEPMVFRLDSSQSGAPIVVPLVDNPEVEVSLSKDAKLTFWLSEAAYKKSQGIAGLKGMGGVVSAGQTSYVHLQQNKSAILAMDFKALDTEQHRQLPHQVLSSISKIRGNASHLNALYKTLPSIEKQSVDANEMLQLSELVSRRGTGFGSAIKYLNTQANLPRHTLSVLNLP